MPRPALLSASVSGPGDNSPSGCKRPTPACSSDRPKKSGNWPEVTGASFAATVALLALSTLLAGGGYDPSVSGVDDAVKHLPSASRQIGEVEWALRELGKLAERRCAAGREPFQHGVQAALSRWHLDEPNL